MLNIKQIVHYQVRQKKITYFFHLYFFIYLRVKYVFGPLTFSEFWN